MILSVISLSEGFGGNIHSFWAIYSFKISFCIVPPNFSAAIPLFSAILTYIARMIAAGAFIVIETVTSSRGIPSKRISISAMVSIATPHLPTSPTALGLSES